MINQELFYERAGLLVEEVQGGSMKKTKPGSSSARETGHA
jgi:hypothetical protein